MSIPLSNLIAMAQTIADMVPSPGSDPDLEFVSTSAWTQYATEAQEECWSVVSGAQGETFFTSADFTVSSGNSVPLPIGFRRLRGLDINPTAEPPTRRSIRKFNFAERNGLGTGFAMAGFTDPRYRVVSRATMLLEPDTRALGSYRLFYVAGPVRMLAPIPVSPITPAVDPTSTITIVPSSDHIAGAAWVFNDATLNGTLVGQTLVAAGCTNAGNIGPHLITSFPGGTPSVIDTDGALVDETFTSGVTVKILQFSQTGGTWSMTGFTAVAPQPGDTLVVTGGKNPGSYPILTASGTTVTTASTGLVDETFGVGVTVSIQRANTSPTLMPELEEYAEFVTQAMAKKALLKEESYDQAAACDARLKQMREDILTDVETDEGEADTIADLEPTGGRRGWGW